MELLLVLLILKSKKNGATIIQKISVSVVIESTNENPFKPVEKSASAISLSVRRKMNREENINI
jgi:hypothetical protein